MKKTTAILMVIGGIAANLYSQGTFNWQTPSGTMVAQTNTTSYSPFEYSFGTPSPAGGPGLAPGYGTTTFYYELLTSSGLFTTPTSLSQFGNNLATTWVDTGLTMTNFSANNGRMLALGYQSSTHAVANNWAAGATQNAMMVGWSANLGSTWSEALTHLLDWGLLSQYNVVGTAYFGISTSIGIGMTPGSDNPGINLFGSGSSQINGSVATGNPIVLQPLYAVPEPGTMLLTSLGGLCLLTFRRKK